MNFSDRLLLEGERVYSLPPCAMNPRCSGGDQPRHYESHT